MKNLIIIIAALITIWMVASVKLTAPAQPDKLTAEICESVQPGMTLGQAETIIGRPADIALNGESFRWCNPGIRFLQVRVKNGAIVNKTLHNIKPD